MKTVKIISDLHINVKDSPCNDFLLDQDKFCDYLMNTCKDSILIINGDLFELLESTQWQGYLDQINEIIKTNQKLYDTLMYLIEQDRVIYINGNHDAFMRTNYIIYKAYKQYLLEIDGVKILAEHGHLADILHKNEDSVITRFLIWIRGWFERLGMIDIDEDLALLKKAIFGSLEKEIYIKRAKQLYDQYKSNIIVFGHTHNIEFENESNYYYVNCGKCCDRENEFDEVTIYIEDENKYKIGIEKIKL
jgi:UDP-2,3-diacylglucosamine pyrophosphatase LpxH